MVRCLRSKRSAVRIRPGVPHSRSLRDHSRITPDPDSSGRALEHARAGVPMSRTPAGKSARATGPISRHAPLPRLLLRPQASSELRRSGQPDCGRTDNSHQPNSRWYTGSGGRATIAPPTVLGPVSRKPAARALRPCRQRPRSGERAARSPVSLSRWSRLSKRW